MTICSRCRTPYDARRTTDVAHDPLLLTGAARLCTTCAPAAAEVLEVLAAQHDLAA